MNITGNELENIFIPDKNKICKTCHKVRIKSLISKYDFDEDHRQNICCCQGHHNQNSHQHNQHQHDRQIPQDENHNQHDGQIQQNENHHQYDGQIPQHEEQNNLEKSVEENRIEHNFETQKNNEGNQYVTKREFNEFKEKVHDNFKIIFEKFDVLSKQIEEINKKILF